MFLCICIFTWNLSDGCLLACQSTSSSVEVLSSGDASAELERARALGSALGLKEVGWAYAHPPREGAFSTYELGQMCAYRDASTASYPEAAKLFVCVRFRPVYEGEDIDGDVTAEGARTGLYRRPSHAW